MCGIVGYTGRDQAVGYLLEGLRTLEYRGYDSAGVEVLGADGALHGVKCAGRVATLAERCETANLVGTTGIAHTRWATHGAPTDRNSHPHRDCTGRIAIVHNGIIENFRELRGYPRSSPISSRMPGRVPPRATSSPPCVTPFVGLRAHGRSRWSAPTRPGRSCAPVTGRRSSWRRRMGAPTPPLT